MPASVPTMLSWLGTQVIPVGSPGYRLNCVSVIFAVVAAFFHYSAVLRWHLGMAKSISSTGDHWRGSAWVALISSGLLVFCPLLWQYSTHAEVFAMNNMFVAILLYLGVRYVQDQHVTWARLGALTIGLGLSNQHTLLLYALPLVVWMLYLGRTQLWNWREMSILMALGLVGLTPYLYLFWAATHAPLGSWGDTSTLSGWPAVGFWTHFLRREYGTFSLYSGNESKGGSSQMFLALQLYAKHLVSADSLYTGAIALVGVASALKTRGAFSSFSAVAFSMLAFYMLIFHYLANLPLDKPLFFGVHVRFWMQSHLISFGFIGLGIERLLSALSLWRKALVVPAALLLVCVQISVNFNMQVP